MKQQLLRFAGDQRGSETMQVIGAAAIMATVIAFFVAGGRIAHTNMQIESAANAAARSITLQRDVPAAVSRAQNVVARNIADAGIRCAALNIAVNAEQLRLPLGQTGIVSVNVSCTVSLGDIALPGLPMSTTLRAVGYSPTDPYSER